MAGVRRSSRWYPGQRRERADWSRTGGIHTMWTTRWMNNPLAVTVNALAAYRITRLITRDSFPPVARVRDAVVDKLDARQDAKNDPTTHPLATLITCPWCAGFWVSAGVTVAATVAPRLWPAFAVPLAFSGVTGLLAEREAHDET